MRESVAFGNLGGAGTSTQALVEMYQRGKGTGVSERDVVKIGNVIERRRQARGSEKTGLAGELDTLLTVLGIFGHWL